MRRPHRPRRAGARHQLRPSPVPRQSGGFAIDTLILLALFVAILVSVVVIVGRLLLRRKEAREEWEAAGRPEAPPRTPEDQARDKKTAIIWGCLVLAVPVVLVLLYSVTR
ncbi:hypothetical protein [Brachybacterium sp.]|uniref:hypothetical protein n=1 Tax=Brachybacterium sp. TaxID=1891286 RepID=UPI002ED1F155